MHVLVTLSLVLVALCFYGVLEYHNHLRHLKYIPLRIHVNGSRGKSSVTRLIAAGLRAGGKRAIAKTTGTLPRIIDIDGNEISIIRNQRANIIEQVKFLQHISNRHPEILVMECMAVLPEYQWLCEKQMVRSHIGVITNARLDHTNEMGKFREQIIRSLLNTCPEDGVLYTSEKTHLDTVKEVAEKNRTEVFRVGGKEMSIEEMKNFSYIEHPANVGLSLAVCEHVGVDRQVALEGMYNVTPDAGALRVALCSKDNKEALFVNAMAANDPESTLQIWQVIQDRFSPLGKIILLLNSRADRQDRSAQLIEMVAGNIEQDYIILTGEKLPKFTNLVLKYDIPKSQVIGLGWSRPERVYSTVFDLIDKNGRGTVLAIGNAGAGGLDIFAYFFKNRRTDA